MALRKSNWWHGYIGMCSKNNYAIIKKMKYAHKHKHIREMYENVSSTRIQVRKNKIKNRPKPSIVFHAKVSCSMSYKINIWTKTNPELSYVNEISMNITYHNYISLNCRLIYFYHIELPECLSWRKKELHNENMTNILPSSLFFTWLLRIRLSDAIICHGTLVQDTAVNRNTRL